MTVTRTLFHIPLPAMITNGQLAAIANATAMIGRVAVEQNYCREFKRSKALVSSR
jgi:hypothetical protein